MIEQLREIFAGPYRAELFIAFGALGCLIALFAIALWEYIRARRADRQVQDEIRMRRGCRMAKRMGWLPDDLQ